MMTYPEVVTPNVGVQCELGLDFRRRTDPSEAVWRTR